MRKIYPLVLFLSFNSLVYSQAPSISWLKTYGGSGAEIAHSILQTTDGGYIVAGRATSDNSGDVDGYTIGVDGWIIKLNNVGDIQWQKILGGNEDDIINSIQQTSDAGYIVAGESNSDGISGYGSFDYWVTKLDNSGNVQWEKKYGGTGQDRAYDIKQTTDGGYIIAGESSSTDGDVTGNHGNYKSDYWIVKLNSNGNIQWEKSLGGTFSDIAYSVQQTTDGGYIVAGTTQSNNGDVVGAHEGIMDYWVVKLDNVGNIVWQKPLGGSGIDEARSVRQTSDGGYIVAGNTNSLNGDVIGNSNSQSNNFWIVKLDSSGNITWQKCPIFIGNDIGRNIQQTQDGGYIIVGDNFYDLSSSNILSVKLNQSGDIEWYKDIGNPSGFTGTTDNERAYSVVQTNDNGYIIAGYSSAGEYGMGDDFYVIKLNPDNLSISEQNDNSFKIYPNPTTNLVKFEKDFDKIQIYDELGRLCNFRKISAQEISIEDLPKGIYFIRLFKNEKTFTKKLIKE